MIILANDLGISNNSVCVITDKLEVLFTKNISTSSKLEHRYRLREIEDEYNHIINKYIPDVVVYEKNYCQLTNAGSALINIEGILLTTTTKYDCIKVVSNFSAKQVKKIATKSGTASKQEMINKANEIFKLNNKNHHIADSLLIGYCYLLQNNLIK